MKRRLPFLMVLLVLVMLGAWWLRPDGLGADRAKPSSAAATASADATLPSAAPEPSPAPASSKALASEPLPAETLPLSQRLAELERLAAGGHAEASCQLVVERLRCGFLQRWQPERGNRSRELRLESEGQLEEANAAAESTLLRIAQKQACGTAPPIESIGRSYLPPVSLASNGRRLAARARDPCIPSGSDIACSSRTEEMPNHGRFGLGLQSGRVVWRTTRGTAEW